MYKISRDVPANIRSSAVHITCLEFLSKYGLLIVQHINWSTLHNYINPTQTTNSVFLYKCGHCSTFT